MSQNEIFYTHTRPNFFGDDFSIGIYHAYGSCHVIATKMASLSIKKEISGVVAKIFWLSNGIKTELVSGESDSGVFVQMNKDFEEHSIAGKSISTKKMELHGPVVISRTGSEIILTVPVTMNGSYLLSFNFEKLKIDSASFKAEFDEKTLVEDFFPKVIPQDEKCSSCGHAQEKKCQIGSLTRTESATDETGSATGCCWCLDTRSINSHNIHYIDKIGAIDARELGVEIPRDIYYCPSCKKSKETSIVLHNKLFAKYLLLNPRLMNETWIEDYINQNNVFG